jgi:hypothetical protein
MDYQKGKIYKIQSHLGPKIYVGSTTKQYLSQRLTAHVKSYRHWKSGKTNKTSSFDLFDEYGVDNCEIVLLELYPCTSKDELTSKESYYITTLDCINKNLAQRSKREYYTDNKEKILEQRNEHYERNKDAIKSNVKSYREKNKEAISEKYKLQHACECGSIYRLRDKSRHEKTNKHLSFTLSNNQN